MFIGYRHLFSGTKYNPAVPATDLLLYIEALEIFGELSHRKNGSGKNNLLLNTILLIIILIIL